MKFQLIQLLLLILYRLCVVYVIVNGFVRWKLHYRAFCPTRAPFKKDKLKINYCFKKNWGTSCVTIFILVHQSSWIMIIWGIGISYHFHLLHGKGHGNLLQVINHRQVNGSVYAYETQRQKCNTKYLSRCFFCLLNLYHLRVVSLEWNSVPMNSTRLIRF